MTFQITLEPGQLQFQATEKDTLLDAALAAGFLLPYGCKNGACGACKAKVLKGEVEHGQYVPSALPEEEKAQGRALLCCATPRSDLQIQVHQVSRADDIPAKRMPCRVETRRMLADDVLELTVKLPASENFRFRAGQYVDFIMADDKRRSFSIANAPHQEGVLVFHIRSIVGGQFTQHLFTQLKEKDMLRFEGPLGGFFFREDSPRPAILLAGGTGFAPIKGIIEHLIHIGDTRPLYLYWGAHVPTGLYQHDLAQAWQNQGKLRYVPVLSNAPAQDGMRQGLVHEAVLADFPDLSGFDVYACGAPAMVEAAHRDFTQKAGLDEAHFYSDAFTFNKDSRPK